MFIVIRGSTQRVERAQALTLLCQISGCQRPIATTTIHQCDVISPDRTVLAAQVYPLISQQSAVEHLLPIKTLYTLGSKALQATNSPIVVDDALSGRPVVLGNDTPTIIADPCAVATREHLLAPAHAGRAAGAPILRGGVFKPRTSPSQFQEPGVLGLQLLAEARKATGLPSITEVMEPGVVETVAAYADGLQIGSRNRRHFPLLVAAGQHRPVRPVLLTRGLSATMEAWRPSAASRLLAGHPKVILCERGIRSYDPQTRNLLDLACAPLLHGLTHLPIIVDPSHATGRSEFVPTMSRHRRRGTRADPGSPPRSRSRALRWSPIDYPQQLQSLVRETTLVTHIVGRSADQDSGIRCQRR